MQVTVEHIFDQTISGLEIGLRVIHIATTTANLCCCEQDDDITSVLTDPDLKAFDQIPVTDQGAIVGLLKRRACPQGTQGQTREYMQPLGEQTLVSADMPLLQFIQQNDSIDRLVINGTAIYGLVTRSDLLKLPVTLLGVALTMHAETVMLNLIRSTDISDRQWLGWIQPDHRTKIIRRHKQLVGERSELDKLELTYISDKKAILKQLATMGRLADCFPSDSFYFDQLEEIHAFRNSLVHTGNGTDDADSLQTLIDRLRNTRKWIDGVESWQKGDIATHVV